MSKPQKQLSAKILVIYMIAALLFLTSVDLHIHTRESAVSADHGFAVSMSSYANVFTDETGSDEIIVSPDSVLKIKQIGVSLLAVFLFIAVITAVQCRTFIGRLRENRVNLPFIPYYGTPSMRAPPQ